MRLRFIAASLLLLFARGCDFYSTSLWFFQENGMAGETNPLTRFFGVGWNGLLLTNAIIIGWVLYKAYQYRFRYHPEKISLPATPKNAREYASLLHYGTPNEFTKMLYKTSRNKAIFYQQMGQTLIPVIIFSSFLATVHNLSQFYDLAYYDVFRSWVGRPLYVIYGLMGASIYLSFRHTIGAEFAAYQKSHRALS